MGQFGAQQLGDGDQVLGAEVATCLGLGGLDQAVEALDIAVGKPGEQNVGGVRLPRNIVFQG